MTGEHSLTALQLAEEAQADFDLEEEWERSGLPDDFTIEAPEEEIEIMPERMPATRETTRKRKVA